MSKEGYIKFYAHWDKGSALPKELLVDLQKWRQRLYELQLIGVYPDGIGFGNISQRYERQQFIISGSTTGQFPTLKPDHYTLVTKVQASKNQLWCAGPIIASSESMSHAAFYEASGEVDGVIHVHHLGLWEKLIHQVPTTPETVTYGTPEMAAAISQLFRESDLLEKRILVMAGHREGIFVFGESLDEAGQTLLNYYKEYIG